MAATKLSLTNIQTFSSHNFNILRCIAIQVWEDTKINLPTFCKEIITITVILNFLMTSLQAKNTSGEETEQLL